MKTNKLLPIWFDWDYIARLAGEEVASSVYELAVLMNDWINGGTYPISFTSEVRWKPHLTLPEFSQLSVYVVPGARVSEQGTRALKARIFTPVIVVDQQTEPEDLIAVDTIMYLAEEIEDRLLDMQSVVLPTTGWTVRRVAATLTVSPEYLMENRVFQAAMTGEWRAFGA